MREQLLNGNLPLPGYDKFDEHYHYVLPVLEQMWHSLWHHYCANLGTTSTIHWIKQAGKGRTAELLSCISILQQGNWIEVHSTDNYSTICLKSDRLLDYVTEDELTQIRFNNRFERYLPTANRTTQHGLATVYANQERTNRKLSRAGMEIGAKSEFHYDQSMLAKHYETVLAESNKGMIKVLDKYPELKNDEANYGDIVEAIIDYLVDNQVTCNMGINNVDSRGRAIKSHLSKVANPIGFKVFRALLVIPEANRKLATTAGRDAIELFVAELNGYKSGTVEGKRAFGYSCWMNNTIPHEPHEAIWCERLYTELTNFEIAQIEGNDYYWSTPIELDASASLLQYVGVLLGDKALLEATNVISEGDLNDPWGLINTVPRSKGKMVLMRQLYGSSQSSASILDAFDEEYTLNEISDLEEGLHTGGYGVANALKSFIIGNCRMAPVMYPMVWKEQLEVPCNRHHVEGERPVIYSSLNRNGAKVQVVHWDTHLVPDTKAFKRWTMTGLIHSLDSRVINLVMQSLSWGIDIHDAVIINPEDATLVRSSYASAMEAVYADRESIFNEYFASVGITRNAKTIKEWSALKQLVTPLDKPFKCSPWAMK